MSKVYLVEGPVGAGKSTYSAKLSEKIKAPHYNLDAWMARLFSPDRPSTGTLPWYIERKERCVEQIWDTAKRNLDANCDVILELGLVQQDSRQAMYRRIEDSGHTVVVHVLDVPREVRRERVQFRNVEQGDTFSMVVPDEIFEMASDMWEEPQDVECDDYEVVFLPYDGS